MSIRDIDLRDFIRVCSILEETEDASRILSEIWEGIASAGADQQSATSARDQFYGFSNPPSPYIGTGSPIGERLVSIKKALADRYGTEYAEDLWNRVKSE